MYYPSLLKEFLAQLAQKTLFIFFPPPLSNHEGGSLCTTTM